ncbi:hypothetical protein HETIRDRAFT_481455 [Heterobasidion irregulare TC 32-1]|uniref:Uncharacterized protein n=1 Tax=Heterobasidion irregulare (strain TC 32-1) TaxID=747525 RepID=W4JST6_HETIT|nr:uncharacterized protein HETIRDRAFT_481455 [Heterobasidion irregulare TC 32-1]ETW75926.1 hypothetical protein HETIRDRAFT_481455 [Heterobasidion irregulare TC 32-1]
MHITAYFASLLFANLVQAIGTLIDARWVIDGGVMRGRLCTAQGALKQAGNVGAALWSFILALHVFNLLFLRLRLATAAWTSTIATLLGWVGVLFIVVLGPLAIHKKEKGDFYGPSGYWCWITDAYPAEQTFLEYFFEWLSAAASFVLYTCILLRVRGNLARTASGRWALHVVPRGSAWRLALGRDMLDSAMLGVAAVVVWCAPVAYTLLIVPITAARFACFAGLHVPTSVTFFADFVYSSSGTVNLLLLLATRRRMPAPYTIPSFTTPRACVPAAGSAAAAGITPFVLSAPVSAAGDIEAKGGYEAEEDDAGEEKGVRRWDGEKGENGRGRRSVRSSVSSVSTVESTMPLRGHSRSDARLAEGSYVGGDGEASR